MTEKELRQADKVTPELAAKYLKGTATISPQSLRCWAISGECPFCHAIKRSVKSHRYIYVVNVEALIRYKHGDILGGDYI